MDPSAKSILELFGLPGAFGSTLLLLFLILALAPYFSGMDFGVVKVPEFTPEWRKRLKWLGPFALALGIVIHIPFYTPDDSPQEGPQVVGKDIIPPQDDGGISPPAPDDGAGAEPDSVQPGPAEKPEEPIPEPPDATHGPNRVQAEIVQHVITAMPKQTEPIPASPQAGELTLVGLVTVEARLPDFEPQTYFLEWVLVTPDGTQILLDSYRGNKHYQFTQRSDAQITPYWVNKTIWTDNRGTYLFRVYSEDLEPVAEARLEIR